MIERKLASNNKSGVKGVNYNASIHKWIARSSVNGKRKHLGVFASLEDAKKAYEIAEEEAIKNRTNYQRTPEHNRAIAEAARNSPKAKAHLAAMNAAKKGVPLAEAHRAKIAASNIGREVSGETRKKISNIHKGKVVSPETREKLSIAHKGKPKVKNLGANNGMWVEDKGYRALHAWVDRMKVRMGACQRCGKVGKTHWANISHQYFQDPEDFIELCVKCHRNYDLGKIQL